MSSYLSASEPKTKIRILFLLPSFAAGGAERSVLNLIQNLSDEFEIHFAFGKDTGPLRSELPQRAILHRLGTKLSLPFRLISIAWRVRPHIVFSTLFDLNIVLLLTRWLLPPGTKTIVREAVMPMSAMHETRYPRFWQWIYRLSYPAADAVVVLSASMRRVLMQRTAVAAEKVYVIENAVAASRLSFDSSDKMREAGKIKIIAVGRLEWQKGYDLLCDAMKLAVVRMPNLRLTVFGDGSLRYDLDKRIQALGLEPYVTFGGYVTNPMAEGAGWDFFISCSRYEGMSNAMLEALCCGIPVIAVTGNNSVEDIIKDRENGMLISEYSADAIATGIIRAARSYSHFDRSAIRGEALRRFSITTQTASYELLFQRLSTRFTRLRRSS